MSLGRFASRAAALDYLVVRHNGKYTLRDRSDSWSVVFTTNAGTDDEVRFTRAGPNLDVAIANVFAALNEPMEGSPNA